MYRSSSTAASVDDLLELLLHAVEEFAARVTVGHLLVETVDGAPHVDTRRHPDQLLRRQRVHEALHVRRLGTRQRPQG